MNDMRSMKQTPDQATAGHGLLDIYLVDPDSKRRAAISHTLAARGLFARPFECLSELVPAFPKTGIILVADENALVAETLNLVTALRRPVPVVAYSDHVEVRRIVQAIHAGAINYLSWPREQSSFNDVIISISASFSARDAGQDKPLKRTSRIVTSQSHGVEEHDARAVLARLTKRENEILSMVVDGFGSRDIGRHFGISHRTVEIHRANILRKLDVRNSVEAAKLVLQSGQSLDRVA